MNQNAPMQRAIDTKFISITFAFDFPLYVSSFTQGYKIKYRLKKYWTLLEVILFNILKLMARLHAQRTKHVRVFIETIFGHTKRIFMPLQCVFEVYAMDNQFARLYNNRNHCCLETHFTTYSEL